MITAPVDAHHDTPAYVKVVNVTDGHGTEGEGLDCANFCITETRVWVTEQMATSDWKTKDWTMLSAGLTERLHTGYRAVCVAKLVFFGVRKIDEDGIVRTSDGEAIHSGTTFSMTLTFPWNNGFHTIVIQVGDSDIFVNGACIECDHSPLSRAEYIRLQSFPEKNRLKLTFNCPRSPLVFLESGEYDPFYYNVKTPASPWRWNSGITPANAKYNPGSYAKSPDGAWDMINIGMTRSIGDYYGHPYGLTHVPQVTELDHPICPAIFIASDGAWDTIDDQNQWVGEKVTLGGVDLSAKFSKAQKEQGTLLSVVEKMVHDLHTLSKEKFGRNVDDITVAVLLP